MHWAYVAPTRPELPAVKQQEWARNPIDRFVLARLEQEGLQPSPEADKATLLRRVTYDLTGLPPTPAEIDAFLPDRSPDAYETLVDALLKSPHYGERMAVPWLDTARYADTHGYHIDSLREMWHWRDWVIDAFNRNLPFDQFTVEQIAGDLLPTPRRPEDRLRVQPESHDQLRGRGDRRGVPGRIRHRSRRGHVHHVHGPDHGLRAVPHAQVRSDHAEGVLPVLRVLQQRARGGARRPAGNAVPFMQLPNDEQRAKLDELKAAIKSHEDALADDIVAPLQEKWEASLRAAPVSMHTDGLVAHYELDGNFSDISGHYHHGHVVAGDPRFDSGRVGKAVYFDGDTEVSFGNGARVRSRPSLHACGLVEGRLWQPADHGVPEARFRSPRHGVDIRRPCARRHPALGGQALDQVGWAPGAGAIEIKSTERLPVADWHQISLTYDGSGGAAGLNLYRGGQRLECDVVHDDLTGRLRRPSAELTLGPPGRRQAVPRGD